MISDKNATVTLQCSVFGMGEIKRHVPHCYRDDHATLLSHSRESFGSKLCAGPRRIRATWKVATKEAEEEEAALGAVHQNQNKYKTNTTQIQNKYKANTRQIQNIPLKVGIKERRGGRGCHATLCTKQVLSKARCATKYHPIKVVLKILHTVLHSILHKVLRNVLHKV